MQNKNLKQKRLNRHMIGLAAAAMFAAAVPATTVLASGDETAGKAADLPLIEISMNDANLMNTIKREVIETWASNDDTVSLDQINVDDSMIELDGFSRNESGIQAVTAKVTLAVQGEDGTSKTVGYTFTQNAAIRVVKSSAPQLRLKSDAVTVNNGDAWNASSYIGYINDDSGILPVIKVDGDVNMEEDGDYTVTYTAVDIEGNSTTASLLVTVKTPEEVIRAREEAERLAEEEAARIAAEEEAARQAAEEEAQRQAAEEAAALDVEYEGTGDYTQGGGSNPYWGGWSNCTYGAWQATYNATGISLPSFGNAGQWVYSAQNYGYSTGGSPTAGSVVVWSGHVAYVDSVEGDYIHVIEGGFDGHYNERWTYAYESSLVGYIYLD